MTFRWWRVAVLVGASAVASTAFAQGDPHDGAGNACGDLQHDKVDIARYLFRITNRCERPITLVYRCSPGEPELTQTVPAQGAVQIGCDKAPASAGEIVYRFAPANVGG